MKKEIKGSALETVDTVSAEKIIAASGKKLEKLSKVELKAARALLDYAMKKNIRGLGDEWGTYHYHAVLAVALIDRFFLEQKDSERDYIAEDATLQTKIEYIKYMEYDYTNENLKSLCWGLTANGQQWFEDGEGFNYSDTHGLDKLSVKTSAMMTLTIFLLKEIFTSESAMLSFPSTQEIECPRQYRVTQRNLAIKIIADGENKSFEEKLAEMQKEREDAARRLEEYRRQRMIEEENAASVNVENTKTPVETVDTVSAENVVKFEVGKAYHAGMYYTVITKRTENFVHFDVINYKTGECVEKNVCKKIEKQNDGSEIVNYSVETVNGNSQAVFMSYFAAIESEKVESTNTPIETVDTVSAETVVANAIKIKCFEEVKADSYLGKMIIEFVKLSEDLEKVGKKREELDKKVFELDLKCTVLEAEGSEKYTEVHDEYITLKEELYKVGDEYREKYERYTFLWNELKWHGANPEEILESEIKFVKESLASEKIESTNEPIETVDTLSEEEDVSEYAVSVEAQEVAVHSEIENAVKEKRRAEKISYLQNIKNCFADEIENVVANALGNVKKNESGSKSAGYTMKENTEGDWVSYLGDRLEFNLANGETYNVWIKEENDVSENAVSEEAQDAAIEAEIENVVKSAVGAYEIAANAEEVLRAEADKLYASGKYSCYEIKALEMTAELVAYKKHSDEVTVKLYKEGKITDLDAIREYEERGCAATIQFSESGNDYRVEVARGMVEDAGLRESEYTIENRKNLHYFEVSLSGLKKLAEYYLGKINAASVKSDITDAAIAEVEKAHEVSTAELEKQLSELEVRIKTAEEHKEFTQVQIKAEWKIIMQFISNILRHEDEIAELNALYCDAEKELSELEEAAAKIKAEILNRQFNASALMTAAMAEKEMEVAPITFDIQQFSEVVNAENAETIDTAVSKSEIPYVDLDEEFDAETKKLADEIEDCDMDISNIDERIEKLQAEIRKLENLRYGKYKERNKVEGENRSRAKKLHEWACATVKLGDKEILLKGRNKKFDRINGDESFEDRFAISIESNGAIRCYLWRSNIKLAEYHTVKDFKAAIRGLAAAIERGDTEFTFPADK